jgi:hypothetical protein
MILNAFSTTDDLPDQLTETVNLQSDINMKTACNKEVGLVIPSPATINDSNKQSDGNVAQDQELQRIAEAMDYFWIEYARVRNVPLQDEF